MKELELAWASGSRRKAKSCKHHIFFLLSARRRLRGNPASKALLAPFSISSSERTERSWDAAALFGKGYTRHKFTLALLIPLLLTQSLSPRRVRKKESETASAVVIHRIHITNRRKSTLHTHTGRGPEGRAAPVRISRNLALALGSITPPFRINTDQTNLQARKAFFFNDRMYHCTSLLAQPLIGLFA